MSSENDTKTELKLAVDLPTIGSKWTHASEPGIFVIADATTDGRVIWTEEGGSHEWVAPVREFTEVFTPLVESSITGPNYPAPRTTGNTLSIDGKVLVQIPAQPAGEHHGGTLDLTGQSNTDDGHTTVLPPTDIVEAIAEAVFQHRALSNPRDPLTVRCDCGQTFRSAGQRQRHAAQIVLDTIQPAIRQQVAEEIAAKVEEMFGEPAGTAAAAYAREIGAQA